MKAIVQDTYGSPDVLNLREIDKPEVGDDEALVRVRAAGVDRGVWHLMTGLPYLTRLAFGFRAPKTPVPGMDPAGVVEAVGKDASRFRPGDEVFGVGKGTFAEYALAREEKLAPKPANLAFEQAAALANRPARAARPRTNRAGAGGTHRRRVGRCGYLRRADRQSVRGARNRCVRRSEGGDGPVHRHVSRD